MDAFTEVQRALDERERVQRLRELKVALEAAEYAASRLSGMRCINIGEAAMFERMSSRFCDDLSIVTSMADDR